MPFEYLPPAFWIISVACFGLAIGSFLNVVIYRWPLGESIVLPASHCGSCGTPIKPYDNIPLLSYIALGGRCRSCKASISIRYPAVEALTGALFLAAYAANGPGWGTIFDCLFVAFMIPLVFIDAETQYLPAVITHPGLVFALVARLVHPNLVGLDPAPGGGAEFFGLSASPDWFISFAGAALGATVGGGFLFVLSIGYQLVKGKVGMGLGDVSMMCLVGAYLGWELTFVTVIFASFVGSIIGVVQARGQRLDEHKLPFGVFLGIGAVLAMLVGVKVVDWYLLQIGRF